MKDTSDEPPFIDIDIQKLWFGKLIESIEKHLLDIPRYQIYSREWKTFAPDHAGVYFVWEDDTVIYVGESANIQKRMSDLQRTRNHTLRRKIGKELFSKHELYSEASSKDGYHD
ncbi:MAG: GIY-YIG nuclease family protein [Firmicutes bacterium]|nr:GIY-YIG nuclease family protein [Bacillota bacterium]